MKLNTTPCLAAAALLLASALAAAQSPVPDSLKAAAQKAVATHPDVTARANALRAAMAATDVARGAERPRVDLEAAVGHTSDRIGTRTPQGASLNRNGVALSVTQLLWDGLATRNEIGRLGHEQRARWFELLDTTEQVALEAVRAHDDVLRFRRLVQLAEDNYVQHRYAHSQIQSRVQAGVGRGVDLEQAAARLALAESNLTTETANLHDVSARYLRIVGELPPVQAARATGLAAAMPASAGEAATVALRDSFAVSAGIEALRAARASGRSRDGAFQPRVEARLRSGAGRHFDGVPDQKRDTTAEILLSWNLYNGGSDLARVRQSASLIDQAADLRDKACIDARQTAAIAFNDTRKLAEQLLALDRNVVAIEKARDAYRQQFDIGQRSLLDLLNAENELYTAKRAYANAEFDQSLAQLRTLAAMQRLSGQLGLTRLDVPGAAPAGWSAGEDLPARCPTLVAEVMMTPRSELDARAQRMLQAAPPLQPQPATPRR